MNRKKLERLAEALENGEFTPTAGALIDRTSNGDYCYCAQGVALKLEGFEPAEESVWLLHGAPAKSLRLVRRDERYAAFADAAVSYWYDISKRDAWDIRKANDKDTRDGERLAPNDPRRHQAAAKVVRAILAREDA